MYQSLEGKIIFNLNNCDVNSNTSCSLFDTQITTVPPEVDIEVDIDDCLRPLSPDDDEEPFSLDILFSPDASPSKTSAGKRVNSQHLEQENV